MTQAFMARLRSIAGASNVLCNANLQRWEQDWRGLDRGTALAVVKPASADQVAAVVRACAEHGIHLVPQGGNTGLVNGSTPDHSGRQLVLSLTRMNRIRDIDADNSSMTAEAGCILQDLQDAAHEHGLLFPLNLAAKGSCTLGGNLSTNAGGTEVLRHGNARALCLGLEVVTADGQIWHGLSGLRKDNTGYALRELFIGSEGTLGIITAATMRLEPLPAGQVVAWCDLPSADDAVALLRMARARLGSGLSAFEIMGRAALQLVARHGPHHRIPGSGQAPWSALLQLDSHESEDHARQQLESLLASAGEQELISDAVMATSRSQEQALWHLREHITLAQAHEGYCLKHDISLPISVIPDFIDHMGRELVQKYPGQEIICFGHLGDGNLHYNIQAAAGQEGTDALYAVQEDLSRDIYDRVVYHGGSFSAEHGIGSAKVALMSKYKSALELALMQAVKQALDPQQRLNPARVLPRR